MTTEREIIFEGWRRWISADLTVVSCDYNYIVERRVVLGRAVMCDGTVLEAEAPDPESRHLLHPTFVKLLDAKHKLIESYGLEIR